MTRNDKSARRTNDRVIFRAQMDLVRSEIAAGWNARAIFDRNSNKLSGMSYRQFVRYIEREIGPLRPRSASRLVRPSTQPHASTGTAPNAGYEPAQPRTFKHEPNPQQDDWPRLIGKPDQPKP